MAPYGRMALKLPIAARTAGVAAAIGIASLLLIACGGSDGSTEASTTTGRSPSDVPEAEDPRVPEADDSRENVPPSRFVPLDNPEVVAAEAATFLEPDDRVLGLTVNGESRAYPVNMMTFHHVANDVVGGEPVLVTF